MPTPPGGLRRPQGPAQGPQDSLQAFPQLECSHFTYCSSVDVTAMRKCLHTSQLLLSKATGGTVMAILGARVATGCESPTTFLPADSVIDTLLCANSHVANPTSLCAGVATFQNGIAGSRAFIVSA